MFLLRHIVDAHPWLYQFYVGVLCLDEPDDFGRVHAGEVHVRLGFHARHLHQVIQYLAILAAGKRIPEAVLRVEAEVHLLGLSDEADGVEDFLLEAWAGVGEDAVQGEGDVLGWGHNVVLKYCLQVKPLRGSKSLNSIDLYNSFRSVHRARSFCHCGMTWCGLFRSR